MKKALVLGAGGFIGHHLSRRLKQQGYWVRGVDIKLPEFSLPCEDDFQLLDLRDPMKATTAVCPPVSLSDPFDEIYNLAADMGGIGYISSNFATICRNNSYINLNVLEAARHFTCGKLFFSSSACVYPKYLQSSPGTALSLRESQAYPADAEKGYGWEKLYAEMLYQYYYEEFGLSTRVARFHNIYGSEGAWCGGREKAPAAICRKIAMIELGLAPPKVEIWGDGRQIRSFCHVDDCIEGVLRLVEFAYTAPVNIGSDEGVTITELVDKVARIAGVEVELEYDTSKPVGVAGRNSDNTFIKQMLGWCPNIRLSQGLPSTYAWIRDQVLKEKHGG